MPSATPAKSSLGFDSPVNYKEKKEKRMNEKENDKKDGANGKKPLEPKPFLPKKGNYRGLLVYQKAECLYDITFYFAHHYFVERKDRTIDQVVQAARSGKQNIAEGCAAAATSAETEIKLLGVARASMQETLLDYEDYLRTRHLEQWAVDDPRTKQIQEYSKTHNRPEDYTTDIDKRSPEALCNIAITLIHQFDNMMGRLLDRLQKDFVEQGGIHEQMTAARLGYRSEQKARIAELEAENRGLKARIAELEQKLRELIGPMGLIGLMGLMGRMGLISLIGLIGPMGLMGCSSSSDDGAAITAPAPQPTTQTAITFSGQQGEEQVVNSGAGARAYEANGAHGVNRANRAGATRAGTPLSDAGVTRFTVWGYKNMSYDEGTSSYGDLQTVFPGYQVKWGINSAATTTTNSHGWEYILTEKPEQTIKYWDWAARAYRYFAVTGSTSYEPNGAYGPNGAYKAYEFTFAADCSSDEALEATPFFTKLWFSTGAIEDYPTKQFGKPVQLEFLKPFSRVRFLFTYSYSAEAVKVTSPSFKPTDGSGIARKGTVTVSYPLTGTATTESYTITKNANPAEGEELEAFTEEYIPEGTEKWYTVFPAPSQGSYTMNVTVDNVAKTAVVPAEYMTWQPGYSYTYIFKITEQGGVEIDMVQSAVTPWTELENDHQVYNW